jgi:hypothetical protein
MAEHSDLVNRADSLMNPESSLPGGRRRRSFVAAPVSKAVQVIAPSPAMPAMPIIEDDDLPVLTEVVSAEAAVSEDRSDRFDETQVSMLASEIAHAIGQQLTFELPNLLEATLLTAGEELRAGITATMETALRDFIARRKQLRLPLDEPDNEK